MDMENTVNEFANTLRNHCAQRTVSLYSENQGITEKCEMRDVFKSIDKQLKAIQQADSIKNRPNERSFAISNLVKTLNFVPLNMIPVEQPPKQMESHKFETQCVLDTQLINIIENAEAIIDAEKGITQEFDSTFCHRDLDNCNNETVDGELLNTNMEASLLRVVYDKHSQRNTKGFSQTDNDETNLKLHNCNMNDDYRVNVEKGMTQEFNITFCHSNQDNNIEEKNSCCEDLRNENDYIQEKNMGTEIYVHHDHFNANNLSLKEDKANIKNNSKSEMEVPKSPILNKIEAKVKSNTPTHLIFKLESFENFESIALPIIENHDFETAKRVINSKISNKDLFIQTHAEAVITDIDKEQNITILKSNNKSGCSDGINIDNKVITGDSMLFSSDEEDGVLNNSEQLPLTCTLQNSFDNKFGAFNKSMYVGFQTASNKCIQVSTDSYSKAKSIFDSITTNNGENISEISSVGVMDTSTKTSTNKYDYLNLNSTDNNNDDVKIEENAKQRSEGDQGKANHLERHDRDMSDNKRIKLELQDSKKCNTNVVKFSGIIKTKDNNFENSTEYLQIDNHILEEFNKDLIPDIIVEFKKPDVNNIAKTEIVSNSDIVSKKTQFDVERTNNDFIGFRTANNKMIKVFAQALEKSKNIFENIDYDNSLPYNSEIRTVDSLHSLCKPRFMNTDNQNIQNNKDFISETNGNQIFKKELKLPTTSSQIQKQLNDDHWILICDNKENETQNNIISTAFKDNKVDKIRNIITNKQQEQSEPACHSEPNFRRQVFKTCKSKTSASSEPVEITNEDTKNDEEAKKIFQIKNYNNEIHDNFKEMLYYPVRNTLLSTFEGFITANNKPVKICKNALAKTKKVFKDIDTAYNKEINDNVFKVPYCTSFQGFKTANNKVIPITEIQLAKCKDIFQDIFDTKEPNFELNNRLDETLISVERSESKSSLPGFRAASYKLVQESKEPVSETKNIIFQGFKTAGNKPVRISAEALSKSKKLFQDIDITDHKENKLICGDFDNTVKEKQSYSIVNGSEIDICQGFKTASNKPVLISAHAREKSKKIFENMGIDCEKEQLREEVIEMQIEQFEKSRHSFTGFNTASNKKVKISEDALLKSRQLLQNIDSDFKNEIFSFINSSTLDPNENNSMCNFGFKTASNTQTNVSREALKRSKNILDNLGEIAKASSNSKFNPEDVISDNLILEDFNSEIIKDFEETACTEDFVKNKTQKSKRSGSPILPCPNTKKRKKFETPIITKKFVAPINSTIKIDTNNVYSFNENYKKTKKYSLKDVNEIEKLNINKNVDPYILNFKFDTILDFVFTGDRNDIVCDIIHSDGWTTDKIKRLFTDSVNKRIIPEGWMENHLKLIIWKLVCYEIWLPVVMKNICTVKNVLEQLKYRYEKELYNVERPAFRKILEKDEVSTRRMILRVAGVYVDGVNVSSVTNETKNIELLLTDGWYTIKTSTDRMIDRLVCEGKIGVGTKLVIHGAELLNCDQGIAPWEDTSLVRLKISGNSTRRAKWDARLGFHGNGAILTRLSAVKPEGGKISHLRTLITRVYPTLYIEKFPDGSTLTRSERLEHIYQMKYETERQIQMEKLYEELERFSDQESQDSECGQYMEDSAMESGSQISRLMKRSRDRDEFRANLTSSQAHLLQQHTLKQKDKFIQALQDKFQELVKKRGLDKPRNVVPMVKIRVADVGTEGITKAMITIWKPHQTIEDMLTEGTWIDIYNVVPTSVRYSEIQISAGRQSVFRTSKFKETDKLKTLTRTLKRQCYTTKDLQNPCVKTDYNEVDTVGFVFLIEPQTKEFEMKNQPFQNVYLSDENKNMICVNFWGGIKKFGFQNILDTGQIVTCVNLQKRAGNTRRNIPQYRATEFSYFTKTSKIDYVRKIADDLAAKFCSLDKRKFIDDCVTLKNNYHNVKGHTENISPYRLNTSDYNMSKNKVFIDSPLVKPTDINLNLTGLDFESTFKQTDTQDLSPQMLLRKRKVNEKIAKLKMYGEPPPLSTIHIVNKSSNADKAFKSPFTKNYISANVANSSANADHYCQNEEEAKDGVANLPQNEVVHKINSSPVLGINRTYVKRASIHPVKLNFSNAIDSFDEDFDGSPPLSLDVNFVT